MILGITGRRKIPNIKDSLSLRIKEINPECIITGMALGTDILVAQIALDLNIKYIAALPFIGQEKLWKEEDQKIYSNLLDKANKVEIISKGDFANWKYQVRNEWIVNKSDLLLAIIEKNIENSGGTFNCINYANSINKKINYFYFDK